MTDEQKPNNNPTYKSRAVLQAENDELKVDMAAIMERLSALESQKPSEQPMVQQIVEALKEDRATERSARLERELKEAYAQIEHLQRPATPTAGIPYSGWAQAKEDLWDGKLIRKGPSENGPGEYFQISLPDYWPGCPFTPVVLLERRNPDGSMVFAPHPDFSSH